MIVGWRVDHNGWWYRPMRPGESTARCFPDQTMGFVQGGFIYTRGERQADMIDRGFPVNCGDGE